MHNALHNNSSPRSLNPSAIFFTSFQFKSLRYFFHEFPIWRLNRAPRLLRGKVDQKNCQSSIEKERKGRMDDAQQFFSTIFKSLQVRYFFSRVSNLTSKQRATIIAKKRGPKKLSIFDRRDGTLYLSGGRETAEFEQVDHQRSTSLEPEVPPSVIESRPATNINAPSPLTRAIE